MWGSRPWLSWTFLDLPHRTGESGDAFTGGSSPNRRDGREPARTSGAEEGNSYMATVYGKPPAVYSEPHIMPHIPYVLAHGPFPDLRCRGEWKIRSTGEGNQPEPQGGGE